MVAVPEQIAIWLRTEGTDQGVRRDARIHDVGQTEGGRRGYHLLTQLEEVQPENLDQQSRLQPGQ